jgi:putative endonuclease
MSDRRRAERRGRAGETVAAFYLRAKGYRILDRRVRTRRGEIDIVACRDATLVFVEVKLRTRLHDALVAVTPTGWNRIASAAAQWAGSKPSLGAFGHRYDLVALQPWRLPVHVRDAWRPDFAADRC